jgi:hypothetical protein
MIADIALKRNKTGLLPKKYAVYLYASGHFDFATVDKMKEFTSNFGELSTQIVKKEFSELFRQALVLAEAEIKLPASERVSWIIKSHVEQPNETPKGAASVIQPPPREQTTELSLVGRGPSAQQSLRSTPIATENTASINESLVSPSIQSTPFVRGACDHDFKQGSRGCAADEPPSKPADINMDVPASGDSRLADSDGYSAHQPHAAESASDEAYVMVDMIGTDTQGPVPDAMSKEKRADVDVVRYSENQNLDAADEVLSTAVTKPLLHEADTALTEFSKNPLDAKNPYVDFPDSSVRIELVTEADVDGWQHGPSYLSSTDSFSPKLHASVPTVSESSSHSKPSSPIKSPPKKPVSPASLFGKMTLAKSGNAHDTNSAHLSFQDRTVYDVMDSAIPSAVKSDTQVHFTPDHAHLRPPPITIKAGGVVDQSVISQFPPSNSLGSHVHPVVVKKLPVASIHDASGLFSQNNSEVPSPFGAVKTSVTKPASAVRSFESVKKIPVVLEAHALFGSPRNDIFDIARKEPDAKTSTHAQPSRPAESAGGAVSSIKKIKPVVSGASVSDLFARDGASNIFSPQLNSSGAPLTEHSVTVKTNGKVVSGGKFVPPDTYQSPFPPIGSVSCSTAPSIGIKPSVLCPVPPDLFRRTDEPVSSNAFDVFSVLGPNPENSNGPAVRKSDVPAPLLTASINTLDKTVVVSTASDSATKFFTADVIGTDHACELFHRPSFQDSSGIIDSASSKQIPHINVFSSEKSEDVRETASHHAFHGQSLLLVDPTTEKHNPSITFGEPPSHHSLSGPPLPLNVFNPGAASLDKQVVSAATADAFHVPALATISSTVFPAVDYPSSTTDHTLTVTAHQQQSFKAPLMRNEQPTHSLLLEHVGLGSCSTDSSDARVVSINIPVPAESFKQQPLRRIGRPVCGLLSFGFGGRVVTIIPKLRRVRDPTLLTPLEIERYQVYSLLCIQLHLVDDVGRTC